MSPLDPSQQYVRSSMDALPNELHAALQVSLPGLHAAPRTVVTTGMGASEGPARVLAAALVERGIAARFCATSRFTAEHPRAELLVVFSQGLSPNARLSLGEEHTFGARWLVTSVQGDASESKLRVLESMRARGVLPIVAPPYREPETLVRLVGPTVAHLMALRLCAAIACDAPLAQRLADAPSAYRALPSEPLGDQPVALITIGVEHERVYAHRWKLLEAFLRDDPPIWDALQFAHGALQAIFPRPYTLVLLERGTGSPLASRLWRTLHAARHRVLHWCSVHDDELSFFEYAATIDRLLFDDLTRAPRDLFDWPARHGDGPLYGLGEE